MNFNNLTPQPDDERNARLDALLNDAADDQNARELAPLVEAARELEQFAAARELGRRDGAQPSDAFTARLDAQMRNRISRLTPTAPVALPAPLAERSVAPAEQLPASRQKARQFSQRTGWLAVAAAALLFLTVGVATVAARPNSPLAKKFQQWGNVLTDSAGKSAKVDLDHERAALANFNAAVSHSDNATALAALNQLTKNDRQAASDISQVSNNSERATLQDQLTSLRAEETTAMRAALPQLDWGTRIPVTGELHALGATALSVSSAHITSGNHGNGSGSNPKSTNGGKPNPVTLTINGSGFTTGATILINGAPAGSIAITRLTSHTIVAQLPDSLDPASITSVGVGEPDCSAASTTHITSSDTSNSSNGDSSSNGNSSTSGQ